MIDASHSPPRGGASASNGPAVVSRIMAAFARGAAAGAAATGANPSMRPMVQRLMWTRRVGDSELAMIDVASRGKMTYRLYVVTDGDWTLAGDFRRYADALAAVERCIDGPAGGDTVRKCLGDGPTPT